jgi:hypothetical protein
MNKTIKSLSILALFFSACISNLHAEENPHSITALAPNGLYVKLDDESIWRVNWWSSWTSWYWKVDERISISPAEERPGSFRLHNPSINSENFIYAELCRSRKELKYRHFVKELEKEGNWVLLDDGLQWKVYHDLFFDDRPYVYDWKPGDEVALDWMVSENVACYFLRNLRTLEEAEVRYIQHTCAPDALTIQEITWDHIFLSDGSKWTYTDWIRYRGWKEGDRVSVYPNLSSESRYSLVDCDFHSRAGVIRIH